MFTFSDVLYFLNPHSSLCMTSLWRQRFTSGGLCCILQICHQLFVCRSVLSHSSPVLDQQCHSHTSRFNLFNYTLTYGTWIPCGPDGCRWYRLFDQLIKNGADSWVRLHPHRDATRFRMEATNVHLLRNFSGKYRVCLDSDGWTLQHCSAAKLQKWDNDWIFTFLGELFL